MLDTIRMRSDYLPENIANIVRSKLTNRCAIDLHTGEIKYDKFNGRLPTNTSHSTIYVGVETEEWKKLYSPSFDSFFPVLEKCKPFLVIECSVHKFFLGHNVYGGTNDLIGSVTVVLKYLTDLLDCNIGQVEDYQITRMDYAETFYINDVENYIINMQQVCSYPKRQKNKQMHGVSGVYFSGKTTTFKIYNKYEEFYKNDFKKLPKDLRNQVLKKAKNLIRVEIEIHKRKLEKEFASLKVCDIDMTKVMYLFDSEVKKVYGDRNVNRAKVRADDVINVLYENHTQRYARILYSAYITLVQFGENKYRKLVPPSTFRRHKSALLKLNISWLDIDIVLSDKSKQFMDFVPTTTSKYKSLSNDNSIKEMKNIIPLIRLNQKNNNNNSSELLNKINQII